MDLKTIALIKAMGGNGGLPGGGSDGQVLTRQGGKAVWGDAPKGFSGSWNDLTEKPFGDGEPIVLIPDTALTFTGAIGRATYVPDEYVPIVNGEEYTLTYDGNTFTATSTYEGGVSFRVDSDYNAGEVIDVESNDDSMSYNLTNSLYSGTHQLSLSKAGPADPIDSAYLPKAAAVADAAGDTPTATEFNALLTALRNAGYLAT